MKFSTALFLILSALPAVKTLSRNFPVKLSGRRKMQSLKFFRNWTGGSFTAEKKLPVTKTTRPLRH
jgi:hypothetical protein